MREQHPYGTFIPPKVRAMIVGSFPIAKFSHPKRRSEIKAHEYDFFFGGEKNLLWKLLAGCFGKELKSKDDVVKMLNEQRLAVGDVIKSCRRKDGRSSDSDLYDIEWNTELLEIIERNKIKTVLFTSKKVAQWFNALFPDAQLQQITLYSPSAQTARGLARNPDYLAWKKKHPQKKTYEFLLESYKEKFNKLNSSR